MPAELVAACEKAMAREPADRFESAAALAAELASWLEGARQRDQARTVLARANSQEPEAALLRAEAALLRAEGVERLGAVEEWRLEEDKAEAWEKEDAAVELDRRAELLELEAESLLRGSLVYAPRLPEAHAALAAHYRAQHEAAEAMGGDAVRLGRLLQDHLDLLPADHLGRSDHGAYLRGDGSLTLVSDPPGAEVALHCYERYRRRLVPRFVRSLGHTPLVSLSLFHRGATCVW
jgi:serine/threonine-protein kinase